MKRSKPVTKKYDRAILNCTHTQCNNEFYVSKASTPANRRCLEHFARPTQRKLTPNQLETAKVLKALGLVV